MRNAGKGEGVSIEVAYLLSKKNDFAQIGGSFSQEFPVEVRVARVTPNLPFAVVILGSLGNIKALELSAGATMLRREVQLSYKPPTAPSSQS